MTFPGSFHVFQCGERDQGHRQGAASQSALTKNRARTGHSRKIVPGLEALTNGWSIKPGPERSEGPAFNALPRCYPRTRTKRGWALTKDRVRTRSIGQPLRC